MERYRVLVLYKQSLFTQGLQRLLERAGDFDVVGVDIDQQDALASLRNLHPDAVVVDIADLDPERDLLLAMLGEVPSVQVVCLTASSGAVNLYRREAAPLTRSEELLRALRALRATAP